MVQSQLTKTRDLVFERSYRVNHRVDPVAGNLPLAEFRIIKPRVRSAVFVDWLWLKWGLRATPADALPITVWIAEGTDADLTTPLEEETLDNKAIWMDSQWWEVMTAVGVVQTLTEGAFIDFPVDWQLTQTQNHDLSVFLYSQSPGFAPDLRVIVMAQIQEFMFQRNFADDRGEIDGTWEELAQYTEL